MAQAGRTNTLPTVSIIAADYTTYRKITKDPVEVNPELAILCTGPTIKQIEAARLQYGPHANARIVIYMNDQAAGAFNQGVAPFPVGSVVVKQKSIFGYTDQNGQRVPPKEDGVGGMVKRPAGYDPAHGDWEYFYFEDAAAPQSGRIASCVKCHDAAKSKDYVFGSWRGANH